MRKQDDEDDGFPPDDAGDRRLREILKKEIGALPVAPGREKIARRTVWRRKGRKKGTGKKKR